jgi:hypothetical protein
MVIVSDLKKERRKKNQETDPKHKACEESLLSSASFKPPALSLSLSYTLSPSLMVMASTMISPVKILDILLSWALLSDTLSVTHLK